MKISGFTMGKNALKLYYPMRHSVESILPLVDEFVVVLGDSDADDRTRAEIEAIGSNKIRIIDTVWDIEKYPRGMEHAHQTDIAMSHCSGDWLFYLQSDEVVHERDLEIIKQRCEELLGHREVEGLLFRYRHFWGDYAHVQDGHCWYRKEIRIVRNLPDTHSWESAQSFRKIPDFDGLNYRQQTGTFKLKVAEVDAEIFHYGWVRPPRVMQNKIKAFRTNHRGHASVAAQEAKHHFDRNFDYGNLARYTTYSGTHPAVMKPWIEKFDWQDQLRFSGPVTSKNPLRAKHDRIKYRVISWIEKKLLGGRRLGEFKNYILLKN
jgi:glycosyltransferase involved in cell wall biosynthesis